MHQERTGRENLTATIFPAMWLFPANIARSICIKDVQLAIEPGTQCLSECVEAWTEEASDDFVLRVIVTGAYASKTVLRTPVHPPCRQAWPSDGAHVT